MIRLELRTRILEVDSEYSFPVVLEDCLPGKCYMLYSRSGRGPFVEMEGAVGPLHAQENPFRVRGGRAEGFFETPVQGRWWLMAHFVGEGGQIHYSAPVPICMTEKQREGGSEEGSGERASCQPSETP